MKRILTLCLLLCSISVAGAEWQERQCEICGKTVYEWVDSDFYLERYPSLGFVCDTVQYRL